MAPLSGTSWAMSLSVYVTGILTGLSLIVAIGAQNAFVLRQGLRDNHVFAVSLTCSPVGRGPDRDRRHQLPANGWS